MQYLKIRLLLLMSLLTIVNTSHAQFFSQKTPTLLPEQAAFKVTAQVNDAGLINVSWSIADDYYMYRDRFKVSSDNANIQLAELSLPQGEIEDDPEFGQVEVYFYNAVLSSQVTKKSPETNTLELRLFGQGCNKPVGVCYPPLSRHITLDLSNVTINTEANDKPISNQITSKQTKNKHFFSYLIAALGAGILLSFTPCVLPMIPILAGIIAGQNKPSNLRSGWLAACYVTGTIITYLVAGALAGATGAQLQAYFQNPYTIGFICLLLLTLALSLFGAFNIQLPSALQNKLNNASTNNKSASITSFILGLVSALVVGACVSPVLILALGTAVTQGDPILGAGIMGAMALGMGLLLIAFGFGAGWLLPKTGAWMTQIQIIFGFMVLAVVIYLLSAFDTLPILLLWACLLLSSGYYLWQLATNSTNMLFNSIFKAIATISIIWGCLAVVGAATDAKDILKPLSMLSLNDKPTTQTLAFNKTTQLSEVQALLAEAKQASKPVLLDFYADWCLDCKRMHRTTFKDSNVINALEKWQLIEIDVTKTSDDSEQAKQFFGIFGPPAMLIFNDTGQEQTQLRQYGYLSPSQFLSHIERL